MVGVLFDSSHDRFSATYDQTNKTQIYRAKFMPHDSVDDCATGHRITTSSSAHCQGNKKIERALRHQHTDASCDRIKRWLKYKRDMQQPYPLSSLTKLGTFLSIHENISYVQHK